MKKLMKNVLLSLIMFLGFAISVDAATINFRRTNGGGGGGNNNLGSMQVTRADGTVPITIDRPTRNGYRFNGWATDSNSIVIDNENYTIALNSDNNFTRTVYATWVQLYNINYNLGGGSVDPANPTTYATGDNITLNNPTRNGYDFTGWTGTGLTGATQTVTIPTNATGNRNYTANWSRHNYTISIDANGGTITGTVPNTYHIQSAAITLPTPTPEDGYEFVGWTGTDLDSATLNVTIPTGSYGDRSYLATYNPIDYTITYTLNNGSLASGTPNTYNAENGATIPDPTRTGYDFAGWVDDATGTNLGTSLVINTTERGAKNLTATWQVHDYSINYELDNGTVAGTNPDTYNIEDNDITLSNPTKEGYTFDGWTGSNGNTPEETVTIAAGSTEDKNYTANFTPIEYNITYNLQGGEATNPAGYTIESPDLTIANPTKDGYEFAGWEGTGLTEPTMTLTIPTGSTGDMRFIALWKEITTDEEEEENNETEDASTTGVGGSDIDDVLTNPQTDDEVIIYILLLMVSGAGIILIPKKRFNN